jgi:hypothetical protein
VKLTVYVREVDQAFLGQVASASDRRTSGWAYRALLEASVREARERGLKVPKPILEQLARLRAETSRPSAEGPQGRIRPRSRKET